jgi:hypothetical protein
MHQGGGQRFGRRKIDAEPRYEIVERVDGKLNGAVLQTRAST